MGSRDIARSRVPADEALALLGWRPRIALDEGPQIGPRVASGRGRPALTMMDDTGRSAETETHSDRIELRVLLLSADGTEPACRSWRWELEQEGVPFDERVAVRDEPLTPRRLVDGSGGARYAAVIVSTDGPIAGQAVLTEVERATLESFERRFRLRRITAFAEPSAGLGLRPFDRAARMEGVVGWSTVAGERVFEDVRGEVPIDRHAYGFLAQPDGPPLQKLVEGPGGAALVGIRMHADGREELFCTVDSNPGMLHFRMLARGMLRWVTRGVYLGMAEDYLGLHIDDVLLADFRWDPVAKATGYGTRPVIRMTPADVDRLVRWQRDRGIPVEMVFNGKGSINPQGPLIESFLRSAGSFRWTSHTWDHESLDGADRDQLETTIVRNIRYAEDSGIAIDPSELVTGEHSGLDNPLLPAVLGETGVRWIAADASVETEQRLIGGALTVPRYPTGLYANTGSRTELLDEDDHLHLPPPRGACAETTTRSCRTEPITWEGVVERESLAIFDRLTSNDPRPHFFHQSNVAEERTFYPVIDAVLERHSRYFRRPIRVPRLSESGRLLFRQRRWRDAVAGGLVRGYSCGDQVSIEADVDVEVPIAFSGEWMALAAGTTRTLPAPRGRDS